MQVPIRTITIISDVLDFLRYEGLLRCKLGRGEKNHQKKNKSSLKNDYRSVNDINFIPDIVFHLEEISTSNKGNG